MEFSKKNIKSWQLYTGAAIVLLLALFGYTFIARIGVSSGTVIPYYPSDCTDASGTQRLTGSDVKAFISAYLKGDRAVLDLHFVCGSESSANGNYKLDNHLIASNQIIYDQLKYSMSSSSTTRPKSEKTTCQVSYSDSDDDRIGDRFVLLDCSGAVFKMSYGSALEPSHQ